MRRTTFLIGALVLGACNSDTFLPDDGGADVGPDVPGVGGDASFDAPTEGGSSETGPGGRYCQLIDAQFCADFDIPADAGAGFTMPPVETNGYKLSFQGTSTKSDPVAVEVDVPADAGGTAAITTSLGAVDAGAQNKIQLDMDMFIPDVIFGPTPPVILFGCGAVAPDYQFGLSFGSGWTLSNVSGTHSSLVSGNIAKYEWAHVNVDIVVSSTSGSATLTVTSSAGTATAQISGVPTAPPIPPPYPILLMIGALGGGPTGQAPSFYYDNVVVHYQ
jgi:hypothetical protein